MHGANVIGTVNAPAWQLSITLYGFEEPPDVIYRRNTSALAAVYP